MAKIPVQFDVGSVVQGLSNVASIASANLSNNIRERTVKYIMGGRKADNPFEQNVVLKNGRYKKSSVARPYPGSPRSYKKPGNPGGCLAVVRYAKQGVSRASIPPVQGVKGLSIKSDRFITGPIGNGNQKTPRKLEVGGVSSSFYRIVKSPKGEVLRWEFMNTKPKPLMKKKSMKGVGSKVPNSRNADGSFKYASWAEVNAAMKSKGQKVGGTRTKRVPAPQGPDPASLGFKGPKSFRVRPRPYVTKAYKTTVKRAGTQIKQAAKHWPREAKKFLKLIGG